jgi:hypothetical protein
MIEAYGAAVVAGDQVKGTALAQAIRETPFSAVLVWMFQTSKLPTADTLLGASLADLLRRHPELQP